MISIARRKKSGDAAGGTTTPTSASSNPGDTSVAAAPGMVVAAAGDVYVTGIDSQNVFRITSGGVITQIMDATGDGVGNALDGPGCITVGATGNIYVAAFDNDPGDGVNNSKAFEITPGGVITEIMDSSGDGINAFNGPFDDCIEADTTTVYVTGTLSHNVFRIDLSPPCDIDTDCNDNVGCTQDTCPAGNCVFTPIDGNCPDNFMFCDGDEFCHPVNDCISTGDPSEWTSWQLPPEPFTLRTLTPPKLPSTATPLPSMETI